MWWMIIWVAIFGNWLKGPLQLWGKFYKRQSCPHYHYWETLKSGRFTSWRLNFRIISRNIDSHHPPPSVPANEVNMSDKSPTWPRQTTTLWNQGKLVHVSVQPGVSMLMKILPLLSLLEERGEGRRGSEGARVQGSYNFICCRIISLSSVKDQCHEGSKNYSAKVLGLKKKGLV